MGPAFVSFVLVALLHAVSKHNIKIRRGGRSEEIYRGGRCSKGRNFV